MQGFEYTTEKAMHRLCIRESRLILRVSNTFKVEETLPNRCKVCPCQIGILRPNKKKQKKNSLLWGFCRPNTSHVRTWLPCRRKKGEIREGQQHRGHVHRGHVASVHVTSSWYVCTASYPALDVTRPAASRPFGSLSPLYAAKVFHAEHPL